MIEESSQQREGASYFDQIGHRVLVKHLTQVAFIAAVVVGSFLLWQAAGRWHPNDRRYPRQGIDISHHQGTIDWPLLRTQEVDFAYIKASEGGDWRDPTFKSNWAGASAARIPRGAYHFFTLCRSGASQAHNFLAAVPVDPRALPPAVDLEDLTHCADGMTRPRFHRELANFLRVVEARDHRPGLLYLTAEFDRAYQVSARVPRPLWLRSLLLPPRFTARTWTMWQASNYRRLDGIRSRVDWNVAR